jgi:hypothetical protein
MNNVKLLNKYIYCKETLEKHGFTIDIGDDELWVKKEGLIIHKTKYINNLTAFINGVIYGK